MAAPLRRENGGVTGQPSGHRGAFRDVLPFFEVPVTDIAQPYLQLSEASKAYGAFTALNDVSLSIGKSEFICFLGPSGCGKTTLLRSIAGLELLSSGRIVQNGQDVTLLPPQARDFGIVFQSYALFPNLTVAANVGYGLYGRKMSREAVRTHVHDMLDLVGIANQAGKYPAQLSGGQQQRVALARALAISPGLLLLDEPLSALDTRVRFRLRGELRALQKRLAVTTIMVTHDQEEALAMADRIVVMNQGRVEQFGTAPEIYNTPATEFVADFVGEMNFVDAQFDGDGAAMAGATRLNLTAEHGALPRGTAVRLAIRPSEIALAEGEGGVNRVDLAVERLEFLGAFIRVHAAALGLGGAALRVDLSETAVRARALAPGATLSVALPAEKLRLFPRG
ncbi:putative 2-aminoethylphosphonate ABC transporter ATP-binding protein [Shinella zoogloeoides]|uniref:Putative 2-aminoethylphosphonate ABC transporter ATP-binding protein n=1 Tax=Shinella zoogloeoides TaxID=352475 RepID=A0A6N8TB59_SHIZO|nr:putative 2-aminoethylphosphonate ABC transporter ATP-binding protein [Shinella zoogloeoides]